jgi:hypothetical protein
LGKRIGKTQALKNLDQSKPLDFLCILRPGKNLRATSLYSFAMACLLHSYAVFSERGTSRQQNHHYSYQDFGQWTFAFGDTEYAVLVYRDTGEWVERQEQHVESRQKWQWLSRIWKRRL